MPLTILETVTSTMDIARERVLHGRLSLLSADPNDVEGILAREQTAGRGQRGRIWFAPYNEALCVTYCLRHRLIDPTHAAPLALLVAVAVADTIKALVTPSPLLPSPQFPEIGLKWPNDILLNGKKLGGILIEMVKAHDGAWVALVGVGLNLAVRAFPSELASSATSLALEGLPAASTPPEAVAAAISRAFPPLLTLTETQGLSALLTLWRSYDRTPGRHYETDLNGIRVEGIATGIDATGALLLRLPDGALQAVSTASSLREQTSNTL